MMTLVLQENGQFGLTPPGHPGSAFLRRRRKRLVRDSSLIVGLERLSFYQERAMGLHRAPSSEWPHGAFLGLTDAYPHQLLALES